MLNIYPCVFLVILLIMKEGLKCITYKFIENGLKCAPPGHQLGPLQKEFLQHYRNASRAQVLEVLKEIEDESGPLGIEVDNRLMGNRLIGTLQT